MHMFLSLLVSICYFEDLDRPITLFVDGLAEGVSGLRVLVDLTPVTVVFW